MDLNGEYVYRGIRYVVQLNLPVQPEVPGDRGER